MPGVEYEVKSMGITSVANGVDAAKRALKGDVFGSPYINESAGELAISCVNDILSYHTY